jgi:hypothetical protein
MKQNKNYKPFDLEKAKAGAKVVTRDGHPAKIICWDREHKTDHIVALVEYTEDGETVEEVITYTNQGTFYDDGKEFCYDLFMAPTVVEKWVNVYKGNGTRFVHPLPFNSREDAIDCINCVLGKEYVTTTKISWEE